MPQNEQPQPQHPRQLPSTTLQELRLKADLTRAELAVAAGVAPNTLRSAEYGRVPTERVQRCIARALTQSLGREVTRLDLWPLAPNGIAA